MRTAILAVLLAAVAVSAQAPIPYRADGYQIGGPVDAPIQMDAFVDVLCPDCAAAWPNIVDVLDYYGTNISVNMHTFPLPYHNFGFMGAQATHVILDSLAASTPSPAQSWISWFTFIFKQQAAFWNGATANMSFNQVLSQFQQLAVSNGFVSAAQFAAGMADDNVNNNVRVSWKFACSKGVLGTPTFFINGVNVNGDPSWTLADWRQILDPLLAPQPTVKAAPKAKCSKRAFKTRKFIKSGATCPAGEPVCNYLPGKSECCFPGENCIPNVGCRC